MKRWQIIATKQVRTLRAFRSLDRFLASFLAGSLSILLCACATTRHAPRAEGLIKMPAEYAIAPVDALQRQVEEIVTSELVERYPGLDFERGGLQEQQDEAFAVLQWGLMLALLVIYTLMAVIFRSYLQPLVVMAAVPFGFAGAVLGHLVMGFELSLVSLLGLLALAGVVINDSLVLVYAVNDFRRRGMTAVDAIVAGATRRFRPVLLTSLTAFLGLAPMIFETSVQARFLIPMALSLGFGVLFVTPIALILVPALLMMIEDALRWGHRITSPFREKPEDQR